MIESDVYSVQFFLGTAVKTTPACSVLTASQPASTGITDTECPHLRAGDTATAETRRHLPAFLTAQDINHNRELVSHPRMSFRASLQV